MGCGGGGDWEEEELHLRRRNSFRNSSFFSAPEKKVNKGLESCS